jgi:hypothetical protein
MKAAMFPVFETMALSAPGIAVQPAAEILPGSHLMSRAEPFIFFKAASPPGATFIHSEVVFRHWLFSFNRVLRHISRYIFRSPVFIGS